MRKIYLFHIVHLLLHSCRIIMGNQAQNSRNDNNNNNGIEGIADKVQETAIIVPGNSIRTNGDENVGTEMPSYVDGKVGKFFFFSSHSVGFVCIIYGEWFSAT